MSKVNFESNQAIGADGAVGLARACRWQRELSRTGRRRWFTQHHRTPPSLSSQFVGNEALGGNNNFGSFAGVGNGGGIYNDGSLELSRSYNRETIAPSAATTTVGDINAGGGYGGGLTSGSVTLLNEDTIASA